MAAILSNALIFEINVSRHAETFKFISHLKKLAISTVALDRNAFILIKDSHIRDPIYIDFLYNFMQNLNNKYEYTVLWGDQDFKKQLIDIERAIYNSAPVKRASEPTDE